MRLTKLLFFCLLSQSVYGQNRLVGTVGDPDRRQETVLLSRAPFRNGSPFRRFGSDKIFERGAVRPRIRRFQSMGRARITPFWRKFFGAHGIPHWDLGKPSTGLFAKSRTFAD